MEVVSISNSAKRFWHVNYALPPAGRGNTCIVKTVELNQFGALRTLGTSDHGTNILEKRMRSGGSSGPRILSCTLSFSPHIMSGTTSELSV
jgi:hypothetical protein